MGAGQERLRPPLTTDSLANPPLKTTCCSPVLTAMPLAPLVTETTCPAEKRMTPDVTSEPVTETRFVTEPPARTISVPPLSWGRVRGTAGTDNLITLDQARDCDAARNNIEHAPGIDLCVNLLTAEHVFDAAVLNLCSTASLPLMT